MSVESASENIRNFLNLLSYEQKIFLFGVINLNKYGLEIVWDFDQVLMQTEVPVADYCDKDLGTHYVGRKITGWNSFSKWLQADGVIKDPEEADKYESFIWTEPKIIKEALPNESLQALSFVAWQRGIKQTINTSRISRLAETTHAQVALHFPWLKDHVKQRTVDIPGISGEDFKLENAHNAYLANPNIVVFDDSMTFMRRIVNLIPDVHAIGFPTQEDLHADLVSDRHIFFPDISLFNGLIYYPKVNVAQSC